MVEQDSNQDPKIQSFSQKSCELLISEFGRAHIHPIIVSSLMEKLFINFYDKSSKPKGGNKFHAGFVNVILSMQKKDKTRKPLFEEMFKNNAQILKEFLKEIHIEELQETVVNSFEIEDNQRENIIKILFEMISDERYSQGACIILATLVQSKNTKLNNWIKKYLSQNYEYIIKSLGEYQFELFLQFFFVACKEHDSLLENLYVLCEMMKKPSVCKIKLIF